MTSSGIDGVHISPKHAHGCPAGSLLEYNGTITRKLAKYARRAPVDFAVGKTMRDIVSVDKL